MTNNFSREMPPVTHLKTSKVDIEKLQNIKSRDITNTSVNYVMLNYDAEMLCNNDTIRGLYNAVVLDPVTRNILSIGTPKSYEYSTFKTMHPTPENIIAEEMIEGVSIQLFYDHRKKDWEISTRNSVSGKYSYYRMKDTTSPTYRDMLLDFIDVLSLNEWDILEKLPKENCYHFILQHPDNHIVLKNEKAKLYFTGYYELHVNGKINDIRYIPSYNCVDKFPSLKEKICLPNIHSETIDSYDECCKMYNTYSADQMGICLLNKDTGDRSFVINAHYQELQQLRGTHPNLMYQYICLKRIDKVKDFLKHFSQYKQTFWKFHEMYEKMIVELHQNYLQHFILKTKPVVDKKYYYHIRQMHETIYKPSLQEDKKVIVKKEIVRKYVLELEPGSILHLLQYEKYKQENLV